MPKNKDPCQCSLSEYESLDITDLLTPKTGTPQTFLVDHDRDTNTTYYFSGCHNVTYPNPLKVTASLLGVRNGSRFLLQLSDAITYEYDDNKQNYFQLSYNANNETATVKLICYNYSAPLFKIVNVTTNELVVISPQACVKFAQPPHGLSNGSIYLLLFVTLAIIYFVGGGLVLYFIRGARGVEIIPNIDFWRNLPGLVKDGFIFILSGCKPSMVSTAETYDKI